MKTIPRIKIYVKERYTTKGLDGASFPDWVRAVGDFARKNNISTDEVYINHNYDIDYYDNPDSYIELQCTRPETDEEYNKRVEAIEKKTRLDKENAIKSKAAEFNLYQKLKEKYENDKN